MESEQAELPTTPRSYTLPNDNTASRNSDTSNHLTADNQLRNGKISPLNPKPQSRKFQFEFLKSLETGKEIGDDSSFVGLLKPSPPEAQEVSSPLKPPKEAHYTIKSPCTPRGPSKGNLKKIARAQRQQAPNPNTYAQNLSRLSRSKRPCKFVLSDEDEEKPHKKICNTPLSSASIAQVGSAVTAKQHCQEPWIHYARTAGELGTPRQFLRSVITWSVRIPNLSSYWRLS